MGRKSIIAATALALVALCAPPAYAEDDVFTGCESVPILGMDPKIRKICDGPIHPDGTWLRSRQFVSPMYVHSSCGGIYYPGGECPPWNNQKDTIPTRIGQWEFFYITADTVPPSEPGHLDNPVRCGTNTWKCFIP